jgi:hypothetical protein
MSLYPQGGRYSYDEPPRIGDHVISPAGRVYLVINITRSRDCVCQRVNDAMACTFQANDLRAAGFPSQVL